MLNKEHICRNCCFWRRMEPFQHIRLGTVERGTCNRFQNSEIELPADELAKPPRSEAEQGAMGQSGRVVTGPEFGCIKFNPATTR
jgi:hypothetical protein